jgi:Aspartyl protease
MIAVDGRKCWTLFDSGARNTYVTPEVATLLRTSPTARTIRTALGGTIKETNTEAVLHAEIEGHSVSTLALVIPNIGRDEEGKPIEILFGALAMQQWGIKLNPPEEKLDLSNYPEEFVEF